MSDIFTKLPNKVTVQELEAYGDNALGVRVLIVCKSRVYCGVVKHILSKAKRIWLIKCITYPDEIPIKGTVIKFYQDISFISMMKIDEQVKRKMLKKMAEEVKRSKKTMKRLEVHMQDENEDPERQTKNCLIQPPAPYANCIRPEEALEISVADEMYTSAIENINTEHIVGLVVKGMNLGRKGALGWLSVSTKTAIYHFDVINIGFENMLDSGFRSLLTHENKVKVIYNSRKFEDYLQHRHKCEMKNIFDIQLTDWYLQMRLEKNNDYFLARNYEEILHIALKFSKSQIHDIVLHNPYAESAWMERPLLGDLITACEFSATFLLEVRQVMIDFLLVDLKNQTDVFCKSVCKMDQYSAEIVEQLIIPEEVRQMWQKKSSDKIIYTPVSGMADYNRDISYNLT